MGDLNRIRAAAEELNAALSAYDPDAMRQVVRDLPGLGEALAGVGDGVRKIANRAEDRWPTAPAVAEALHSMAGDISAAGDTANVGDQASRNHEADIERHDAPRKGSRAAEARWDVTTDEG
jgi:hypothetical protein